MSTTLSYGYKKPADGETGATFYPDLNTNAQLANDHVHDGVTGTRLNSSTSQKTYTILSAANWVSAGNGLYYQYISYVGDFNASTNPPCITFYFHSGTYAGSQVALTVEAGTSNQQGKVYINDNTQSLKVVYA